MRSMPFSTLAHRTADVEDRTEILEAQVNDLNRRLDSALRRIDGLTTRANAVEAFFSRTVRMTEMLGEALRSAGQELFPWTLAHPYRQEEAPRADEGESPPMEERVER